MTGSRQHDPSTGLTAQQQRFCDEYLVDYNGTAAYQRAGYSAKPRSAAVESQKLLAKPAVQAYLRTKAQALAAKLEVTAEATLRELARVAFFDPRRAFNSDGSLKPIGEWDDDTAAAIAGIEVFEEFEGRGEDREQVGHTKKVKIASKVDALGKLAQHFGLLQRKVELTGPNGGPVKHEHQVLGELLEEIDGADTGID